MRSQQSELPKNWWDWTYEDIIDATFAAHGRAEREHDADETHAALTLAIETEAAGGATKQDAANKPKLKPDPQPLLF